MRIAEQRDAVGPQRVGAQHRVVQVLSRLVRQAVHQVEVEIGDPGRAQHRDRGRDRLERLHPADRLLHMRREFLHAEARAIDPDRGQRLRERGVALARIDLDRVLGDARAVEPAYDPFAQRDQSFGTEHRGRAAAPMDRRHALAFRARGDEIDFLRQQFRIGVDRRTPLHDLGVTAAIEAEPGAVGNMQVERQARLRIERIEPVRIGGSPDGRAEMRRGRIGCVARRRLLGENACLQCHAVI